MRLTYKNHKIEISKNRKQFEKDVKTLCEKLGQLEDIEEELGIDLITLFKAIMNDGLVYIKFDDNLSKCFNGNNIFVVDIGICCKWNFKCYPYFTIPFGTFEVTFYLRDYGKTWALTKEELL